MISPFMFNQIIVPKETFEGERRVAASPETVRNLRSLGYEIAIEQGAGEAASFSDEAYREQGAEIVPNADALWQRGDIVLKVRAPSLAEADQMKPGTTLISFIAPAQNPKLLEKLRIPKRHRAGGRPDSTHYACAKTRRAEFDGQYRRLSRGH